MNIDFDLYKYRKLSDTFRLYWRILRERKEIEVAMVVNGTSYVGLGWRPRNLTSSCKNFPLIGNPVDSLENTTTNAEPNATSEPTSSAEPGAEPTSEPASEPTSEPNSKPENLPTAEPNSEPEPTTLSPTTKKSLYARRSATPTSISTATYREEAIETSVSYKVSTKQGTVFISINLLLSLSWLILLIFQVAENVKQIKVFAFIYLLLQSCW